VNQAFTTQLNQGIAELVIAKPPVNALDSQEWLALARQIEAAGFAVHVVGDAKGVSYIEGAMRGAAEAVREIAAPRLPQPA